MHPDLRAFVLDPKGIGTLPSPLAEAQGENPVCGDHLSVQLDLEEGKEGDTLSLRWKAKACPATLALASLAFLCYEGGPPPDGPPFEALRASLARHGGLSPFQKHALQLVEETLGRALLALPKKP